MDTGLSLTNWKDIAAIAGVIVGCIALVKGFNEYRMQGRQKRAEHFFNLRRKLKDNPTFTDICKILPYEKEWVKLEGISSHDKRDFLGLFEEVAIMKNSKLIKSEVAYYMFGCFASLCWKTPLFWHSDNKPENDVDRNSNYWKVFRVFAEEVGEFEKNGGLFNADDVRI